MEFGAQDFSGVIQLYRQAEGVLMAFLMVLPRAYAFIAASQLLAATAVPRLARNTAILVLAMPITPAVVPFAADFDGDVIRFGVYFFKEFALGFVMGTCIAWLFWAVQAAGAFIDNQRGAAIAASIDPLQGHETSPLGILFGQAFVTYFFALGGFLIITGLLYQSYAAWPVDRFLPLLTDDFPAMMLEILDLGMRLTVILSAPVIAIMFISEFALAMISRFAPQVQVFILAMPIKSALAIFLLIFYLPILMREAVGYDDLFPVYLERLYEMLRLGQSLP